MLSDLSSYFWRLEGQVWRPKQHNPDNNMHFFIPHYILQRATTFENAILYPSSKERVIIYMTCLFCHIHSMCLCISVMFNLVTWHHILEWNPDLPEWNFELKVRVPFQNFRVLLRKFCVLFRNLWVPEGLEFLKVQIPFRNVIFKICNLWCWAVWNKTELNSLLFTAHSLKFPFIDENHSYSSVQ